MECAPPLRLSNMNCQGCALPSRTTLVVDSRIFSDGHSTDGWTDQDMQRHRAPLEIEPQASTRHRGTPCISLRPRMTALLGSSVTGSARACIQSACSLGRKFDPEYQQLFLVQHHQLCEPHQYGWSTTNPRQPPDTSDSSRFPAATAATTARSGNRTRRLIGSALCCHVQ